jgi:hypothetical protein
MGRSTVGGMKRIHALLIATAVAAVAVLGLIAATRTMQLGAAASQPKVTATEIAKRNRTLDRIEASLSVQAARKPPALPALPSAAPAIARPAPSVLYVRLKPLVRVVHRHGEHETEHDGAELDD